MMEKKVMQEVKTLLVSRDKGSKDRGTKEVIGNRTSSNQLLRHQPIFLDKEMVEEDSREVTSRIQYSLNSNRLLPHTKLLKVYNSQPKLLNIL